MLLEMISKVSASTPTGGSVRAVVLYQRISNRLG